MWVPLRAARSCLLWGGGPVSREAPQPPRALLLPPPRCWHVNHTCVPASPHQLKLTVPWLRMGPGGQTLRRGPALAARRPPPGYTRGLQMLVRAGQPWSAAPTGPPARAHRVKHSEGGGPERPSGRPPRPQTKRALLPDQAPGGSFTKKPVGPRGLWPGLRWGLPQPPPPAPGSSSSQPTAWRGGSEAAPGRRLPSSATAPHTQSPPYGGQLLISLTPGLSPPPGAPLQAWPPPHPPLASSRSGTLSALSPGCLRGLGAWDHDPHPHPAVWPATCRGTL